ncbi:helix-turn-helix domain-containing protein [Novacetimonas hansenii]|uniref:helix-turn-helix domain-containing protein n=1 Tax=Novacetimonas hansenii TaxID=436 RepID=UPI00117B1496|nr:helix-turn-helix domain-containing protein [Novacetimonas hansenii]
MKEKEEIKVWKDPFDIDAAVVRKLTGLSQRDFANRYGFSLRTLQEWEQGRGKPDKSSRTLLGLIAVAPQELERAFRKMSIQQQNAEQPKKANSLPKTYFGMTQGESYAFADLPSDQADIMIKNLSALGWSLGGGHPLMNSENLPPLSDGCIRIWGINWPRGKAF